MEPRFEMPNWTSNEARIMFQLIAELNRSQFVTGSRSTLIRDWFLFAIVTVNTKIADRTGFFVPRGFAQKSLSLRSRRSHIAWGAAGLLAERLPQKSEIVLGPSQYHLR